MYECPTNAWLPYYMLVGGLLQLSFIGTLAYKPLRKPAVLGAVGLAAVVWMLIGKVIRLFNKGVKIWYSFLASINIFVEWKPDFFFGGFRYCNKTLFYFVFFISAAEYIIFTVLLLYICTQFAYSKENDITWQTV